MSKRISKTPCLGGIYRITCEATGKSYVGSTKHEFRQRWRQHCRELKGNRHPNRHLQGSWNKYGEDVFEFHPLEPVAFIEDLIDCEQKWIDLYQSFDRKYGFNIAPRAGRSYQSEETRAKMSAANLGRVISQETRAKISAAHKGKKHTPEHAAKTRAVNLGRKHSAEARANMSAFQKGRKRTPEHVANLRAAHLGRVVSQEVKAKISAANLGRKHDAEVRARMSAAHRSYRYRAISPDGTTYEDIMNLAQFCEEFGLHRSAMRKVAQGKQKTHKGWLMEKFC